MNSSLLSAHEVDGVQVVTFLSPDLVEHTVNEIRQPLLNLIGTQHKRWILSLKNVRFLASAGLGLIVQAAHRVTAAGGKLVLAEASPPVAHLFTGPTHLIQVVPLYNTEQDAVNALNPR